MQCRRLIFRFALALIAVPLLASVAIILAGLHDNLHPTDLAVVLGNTVEPNGQPSPMLKARLDQAIALYRQGYFRQVLVSGAHGKEGYDEPAVMRRYLEANGLPSAAIFEDNEGYTTWHTAQNTARFLKVHNLTSVLIISQYFHLPRCRLAFSKFGIQPLYASHAPYWSLRDFYSVPREIIGYTSYALRQIDGNPSTRP